MKKTILVLAEKPAVGRDMAAWLSRRLKVPASPVGRTHIEVGSYRVSWLFGHVLENAQPHDYDPAYKRWAYSALPIIPSEWRLLPKDEAKGQISVLKKLLAEAGEVIGLGDPDQEGQLLQDEFLRWAGCRLPTKRLWLSSLDDATVAKAFDSMKPNSHYEGYYWSALARSHADWLAGINLSRACTLASQSNGGNATLSVGRVQTPTLALIVAREKEIRAFKPVNYFIPYVDLATAPAFRATWSPDKEKDERLDAEGRLLDKKVADALAAAFKKAGKATVVEVKSTKGKDAVPLPFSLSTLQEHMSRKYSMGVQDTLKYAQALYEKKIASYPRTDSEYLPTAQLEEAPGLVDSIGGALGDLAGACKKANLALVSRAWNDKKVTAHHAIVPRPVSAAALAGLSSSERLVWLEIAKRYLLQFFPEAAYLATDILLDCAGESLRATGKVYIDRGWKDAFAVGSGDDNDEDSGLPKVKKGQVLEVAAAGVDSKTTRPPKRYTEGTLVAAMKSVHRFVADPKLKAVLRENIGIGTEATRANIIGELFGRKFIELVKNDIKPTGLGESFIDALPAQLAKPDMTALWQQAMDDIQSSGEPGYTAFLSAQAKWLHELIRDVPGWFEGKALVDGSKKPAKAAFTVKESEHTCLKCGSALKHIKGKFGWFFGCSNEACKATFKDVDGKPVEKAPVATETITLAGVASGSTCPECKKGTMQVRTCGPHTRTPGKQFLSCSQFFAKGKAKCGHSVWPK